MTRTTLFAAALVLAAGSAGAQSTTATTGAETGGGAGGGGPPVSAAPAPAPHAKHAKPRQARRGADSSSAINADRALAGGGGH